MSDVTLRWRAYESIQAKLLEGELRVGDTVSEAALAAELGMSRTPVREAISQLEIEGLFEREARMKTTVRAPGRREVSELYQVREALESFAVASARLSADDLETLRRLHREMADVDEAIKARGLEFLDEPLLRRYFQADIGFHLLLVQAAGNERALRLACEFRVVQHVFEYGRLAHGPRLVQAAAIEHGAVLEALLAGERERAREAMAAHIRAARDYALEAFDRRAHRAPSDSGPERPAMPADIARHLERLATRAEDPPPETPGS